MEERRRTSGWLGWEAPRGDSLHPGHGRKPRPRSIAPGGSLCGQPSPHKGGAEKGPPQTPERGALEIRRPALKAVLAPLGVSAAYVFAPEGVEPETDVHARLIDPDNAGEDPFTGSAAGCMASYMHAHGLCSGTRIRLEQGHILDRPGTGELELILASDSGKLDAVRLGGTAVSSASGTLRW